MPLKSVAALALSTATLVLLWYLFWQPEASFGLGQVGVVNV
jgi:hypothetical protein